MHNGNGVTVILSDGREHIFPRGRSWVNDGDGQISIRTDDGEIIAIVAYDAWSVVGFYTAPQPAAAVTQ